jgi:hypothetical protein
MRRLVDSFPRFLLVTSLVALLVSACSIVVGKPIVVITSPPSGSEVFEGQTIVVQSTSTDPSGVARIELSVDSATVRTDSPLIPQASYIMSQTWAATPGKHTLIVRAFNKVNVASDPAAIAVSVLPGIPTPTPMPEPTATSVIVFPVLGATLTPAGCTNDSRFVADVTIPDGTPFNGGQTFDKIWRLSNSGTCPWGTGYRFSYVGGTAMTPNITVNVSATASGATTDIKVPMTAPSAAGAYTGNWQMRAPTNSLFGQRVTVVINVNAPAAPTGCAITSFVASPGTINAGEWSTLTWGPVLNAISAEIDQGIGGVETPGTRTLNPPTTTTYTLIAHCGTFNKIAQVTVTVVPNPNGCSGSPNITYFNVSNNPITKGGSATLNWGPVTNAESVEIQPDIGGIATPGSASVSPSETTTYVITAHCRTRASTREVTITVNP